MTVNIPQVFKTLLAQKRLFNSEADLQFALAWEIQTQYPQAKIYLEYVPWQYNTQMHIDIVVQDGETLIPIELKYKTKGFSGKFGDVDIVLKNHGAQDQGRYDFLKDIERLEGFCGCKKYTVGTGYAIFLTNDSMYWEPSKRDCVDKLFRIHKGREITGDIHWVGETKPGTTKGRDKPLHLEGQYQITWNPYELAKNTKLQFQYTIIEINKINKKQ